MCNGTIMDKLISFSVPLMLSGILQLMFNAVDIIVVGRFAGSQSLAAVGSTTALINMFVNLFIGVSLGQVRQPQARGRIPAFERIRGDAGAAEDQLPRNGLRQRRMVRSGGHGVARGAQRASRLHPLPARLLPSRGSGQLSGCQRHFHDDPPASLPDGLYRGASGRAGRISPAYGPANRARQPRAAEYPVGRLVYRLFFSIFVGSTNADQPE